MGFQCRHTVRSPLAASCLGALLLLMVAGGAGCSSTEEKEQVSAEAREIANLRNNVDSLRTSLTETQRERDLLKEAQASSTTELGSLNTVLGGLETQYRVRMEELKLLKKQLSESEQQMTQQKTATASVEEMVRGLTKGNEKLEKRVKDLETELREDRVQLEKARADNGQLRSEAVAAQTRAEEAERSQQNLPSVVNDQLDALRADKQRLEGQVKDLYAKLEGTEKSREEAEKKAAVEQSASQFLFAWCGRSIGDMTRNRWPRDTILFAGLCGGFVLLTGYAFLTRRRVRKLKAQIRHSTATPHPNDTHSRGSGSNRVAADENTEVPTAVSPPARPVRSIAPHSVSATERSARETAKPAGSVAIARTTSTPAQSPSVARAKPAPSVAQRKPSVAQPKPTSSVVRAKPAAAPAPEPAAPSTPEDRTERVKPQPPALDMLDPTVVIQPGPATAKEGGAADDALLDDLRRMIEKNLSQRDK